MPDYTEREGGDLLLRELHEAMADVMVLRRQSSNQQQRDKADAAIAVWRKVERHLKVSRPDAEEDDRSWLGDSIDRIDAMDDAAFERATTETERLQRELDITNADHIALWLEANTIPDEPMSQCISWLACRIVEAHEAANGRARNDAAVAIADEIIPDSADGDTSPIQRQAYWHVAHRAALAALDAKATP